MDAATTNQRVSQAEYARHARVTRQRINQLVKDGRIALDADGLIEVGAADIALAGMLDRSKAHRSRQLEQANAVEPALAVVDDAQAQTSRNVQPQIDGMGLPGMGGANDLIGLASRDVQGDGGANAKGHDSIGTDEQRSNAAADYWEHKARRERAEAESAEMRVAERRGALVNAEAVRRSRLETAHQVANVLRQLPAQLAPVAAPSDPQRVIALWTEAIDKVLAQLADDLDPA